MIGRYLILSEVGRGGMGTVFAAFDPDLDRRVALKLLPLRSGRGRQRLTREARVLAKFTHPNVATVFDVGATDEWVYIAMELVEGGDLDAWLEQEPRSPTQIISLFVAAGRGLVAAHDKGLIHRDFKPSNVLIGEDGRIRVADFGLAQIDPQTHEDLAPGDSLRGLVETSPSYGGTPGFVAPEVREGRQPDARADQYAFCVSLAWALTDVMPGPELDERLSARHVPSRVRRVLARGLAHDPDARFASMSALLDALADRPRRRLRFVTGAALGLVFGGVLAALAWPETTPPTAPPVEGCEPGQATVELSWTEPRAARLRERLSSSEASYAKQTALRVDEVLDAWAEAWTGTRAEICADGGRSSMSRARLRCLDARLVEFESLLTAFEEGEDVVERAADATARLGQPGDCLRPSWRPPSRVVEPPPQLAPAVEASREALTMAEAYRRTGQFERALDEARAVHREAESLGYQPLLAQTYQLVGQVLVDHGRYEEGVLQLRQSFAAALASGDDTRLLESGGMLLNCVGYNQSDDVGARLWRELGGAALERSGGSGAAAAGYWDAVGNVSQLGGDYEQARAAYEHALGLRQGLFPAGHPELTLSIAGLAALDIEVMAFADAERRSREVLALRLRVLGPDHPDLVVVYTTLAAAVTPQGKHEEAIAALERALAIGEASFGADHPQLLGTRNNLAAALNRRGDLHRAKQLYVTTLVALQLARGPDDPVVGLAHNNLAASHLKLGEYEAALEQHGRALTIWEASFGHEHLKVALALNGLGSDLIALERCAEARSRADEALAILSASEPSPLAAYVNNTRARALLCQGQARAADESASRAVELGRATMGSDATKLAAFMGTRALTLLASGELEQARAMAEEAASAATGKPRAEALFTGAQAARRTGDEQAARALAEQALEALPRDTPRWAALELKMEQFLSREIDGLPN